MKKIYYPLIKQQKPFLFNYGLIRGHQYCTTKSDICKGEKEIFLDFLISRK